MADTAIRLLRSLDPEDEEMGRLEELKLQAEHRARERSAERNAECPDYITFIGAKTVSAYPSRMVLMPYLQCLESIHHPTYRCRDP